MAATLNDLARPLPKLAKVVLLGTGLIYVLGVVEVLSADDSGEVRRTSVVRAIERAKPSVVSIHAVHLQPVYYRSPHRDPFFEFFAPPWFYGEREKVTAGSGFIVDADGHILTNDHVVGKKPVRIIVNLDDGREFEARDIGRDYFVDLAVLKVDATDLPVAQLGESGDILVGEQAIAIGNPFDLGPTASAGIVSAIDRDFGEPQGNYYYRDMIQTDAAINRGNSGGPLVNAAGQVIGINSFIYTGSDYSTGSIGIGFAIPIDVGVRFLDEIRTYGRVRRPWHGILGLRKVTRPLARYLELSSTDGAFVDQVAKGSPAYEAELGRGDVIVIINGEPVRTAEEAKGMLQRLRVGEECSMQIVRDGEHRTVSFVLEDQSRFKQRRY